MNRTLALCLAGTLGALVAWGISEPFVHTAATGGTHVGEMYFTLGSFFGWFAHAALGGFVVGGIAFVVSLGRTGRLRAVLAGLMGLLLGGLLGCGSDALSDRLMISMLQGSQKGEGLPFGSYFFWNLAVGMSLALGVGLSCQPTMARMGRVLVGGVFAAVLGFFARMAVEILTAVAFVAKNGMNATMTTAWRPYDPARLADNVAMGLVLGLSIALADVVMTSGRLRLLLGRNEGRDFPLGGGANRIGSAEGNEVMIRDPAVAPVHAVVFRHGPAFVLQDMGCGDGTRVNGVSVQHVALNHGDTIQIGDHSLVFATGHQPAPSAPVWTPVVQMAPPPVVAPSMHRLVDLTGAPTELPDGVHTVGREPGVWVAIPHDVSVSRRHAEIAIAGPSATLQDLGSTNGTSVNGDPLREPRVLNDGDVVRFGYAEMVYRKGGGA